ncbi:hypothetical protein N8388_08765, partial [Octadecabacter sp.]|nr:hypothetical protein [Octadecabacter sp.]
VYNAVTRGLLNWSDGEGTGHRIANEGPQIISDLMAQDGVAGIDLSPFALPAQGTGIYAFVEKIWTPPLCVRLSRNRGSN